MDHGEKYTDERLLREMRQEGVDVAAYERLFHRYYPMVFNFTKAMVKSPAIAEDIAQNSFMKLWVNRFTLQPDLSVKNYLYVIARNEAINYLRSAQTRNVGLGAQQEAHHQEAQAQAAQVRHQQTVSTEAHMQITGHRQYQYLQQRMAVQQM